MNGMFNEIRGTKEGVTCDSRDAQMNGMLLSPQAPRIYTMQGTLWVAGMIQIANP